MAQRRCQNYQRLRVNGNNDFVCYIEDEITKRQIGVQNAQAAGGDVGVANSKVRSWQNLEAHVVVFGELITKQFSSHYECYLFYALLVCIKFLLYIYQICFSTETCGNLSSLAFH